jgi:hypothetical protein
MKTSFYGVIHMYVQKYNCDYTIADPDNKLNLYNVISHCPKCGCYPHTYRSASSLDKIKISLKFMDVYK